MAVYKHLLDINAGFDQVIRGLAALRSHDVFLANELITTVHSPKRPVQQPTRTWSVKLNATKPRKPAGASAGTENARRKQNSAGGHRLWARSNRNGKAGNAKTPTMTRGKCS